MSRKKEDRSDWVAIEPEHSAAPSQEIRKASSAFQFFQKDVSESISQELRATSSDGKVNIALFGRAARDRWQALSDADRQRYEDLARQDAMRFAQESHAADVAALERREKLRAERETLLLDDEGGGKRTTRGRWERKQKKKARADMREKTAKKKKSASSNDEDFVEEESSSSSDSFDSQDLSADSDDSEAPRRKKKPPAPRQLSQKQIEYRDKKRAEKEEKEKYIAERQDELRKEKAGQAKRRLEFLLKQSNIFSHFGNVKEDTAKYGINVNKPSSQRSESEGDAVTSTRRSSANEEDDAAALEEADEHEATFLTTQPSSLAYGQMRPYQLEGLNWMIRLQENGVNGILADEMGLGKTLQSISVLVYMQEYRDVNGPHLVVVPKSTLSNWMNEFSNWAPNLSVVKFHGDKETREDIAKTILEPGQRDEDRDWHVVVTTYEVCNIEKNVLGKFAWSYLIIDEAHRLKNEASAFSKTVREFETRYRILLTGTPLQNSLHELWALLNFLVPDIFESAEQFDEWFDLDIDDKDEKNKLISQLHKILRPFMLRRLKADVEKDLPPKHETILFTGMSAMQKKLYRDILMRDIDAIQGKSSGNRTAILNIVMQLRKCAGHPYLFPNIEDRTLPPLGEHLIENCGKLVVLDKLLKRLRERGHRVLLFTQMTRILDIMEDYLVYRRFSYCRIDGNTSYDDREAFIDTFNAPNSEKFIFLLSTRAGGLGINLQTADVVILFDSDWNPQADLQAQDRAHRIGQKKPVQVFRLVTEHTIEEKIVERAQQKLKLDAMVVQQGRLKEKDKLSRDELLAAVRFGADKIFKSKDSSITDDDIDLILDAGKRKTQELNEKLQNAEKGDLLDFKLDGSSVQTFEGVDYSTNALAQAQAQAEMLGIFDIGKRERKEANYNESSLYQQQILALQGSVAKKPKKKKVFRLPKYLRLPRMEEWQMYDRPALIKIQEEEEAAFKDLPEEIQKRATTKVKSAEELEAQTPKSSPPSESTPNVTAKEGQIEAPTSTAEPSQGEEKDSSEPVEPFVLPPLIDEERQAEKGRLLAEGFSGWSRRDYTIFVKASASFGRNALEKIALETGKPQNDVEEFAAAFWGDLGRSRISEHEYDRVTKLIERGEKKIGEIKSLERATRILVSHFDNPWQELEFTHVNTKDKFFTAEEDRYLLCWTRKYGYGQWQAIQLAIRRCAVFRFDYFLRSLPVDYVGKRCEQLMRAAEKEVEHLERAAREEAGLPVEPEIEGQELPPIELPNFRIMERQRRLALQAKREQEGKHLREKVEEIESQMQKIQQRLKDISEDVMNGGTDSLVSQSADTHQSVTTEKENGSLKAAREVEEKERRPSGRAKKARASSESRRGAIGPDGEFAEFPPFDGTEEPTENKKPFTHFCIKTRKEVKASLDHAERKNKKIVNGILKERWMAMSEEDKEVWRKWAEWDKQRYAHDLAIYEKRKKGGPGASASKRLSVDKNPVAASKRSSVVDEDAVHVPKKKRRTSDAEARAISKKKKRS